MTQADNIETVVIIGGSSSIGKAISDRFLFSGTRVITSYTRHTPTDSDTGLTTAHLDFLDDDSIDRFAVRVGEMASRVDGIIFLSAVLPGNSLDAYEFSDIDEVMAVNFNGQAKLLGRMMSLLTGRSRLLMFSSISAQRGSFDPIYAASKGALLSFVKSLASRLPAGARINAIAPGLIQDSQMYHDMSPDRQEFHRKQIPSMQLLSQQDLANVVFDLFQDHWSHLNGACIDLNGGQYVR